MPKIIIDHREDKNLVKELIKEGLSIEKKQLEIADIVIQTKNLQNKEQTVGIERKTTNDLLNSIIDKRLLNQLMILKENFDVPLLIMEGESNIYKLRNFHPNSIRGMISTIAIDFQIPIIHTQNHRDTAKYISLISKRLEKTRKPLSLLPKRKPLTPEEKQQYVLESFPGIGPTIAGSIRKKFSSIKDFINATEKEMQKVEKLGKIKSKEIKRLVEEKF